MNIRVKLIKAKSARKHKNSHKNKLKIEKYTFVSFYSLIDTSNEKALEHDASGSCPSTAGSSSFLLKDRGYSLAAT